MTKGRSRIKRKTDEEECGFVRGTGTKNAIFMLRMTPERAKHMLNDVYPCFIH